MLIKSINLRNGYKRFQNLEINLGDNPSRIVALVGPNGCGKSSVFDGMLFHHNAYGRLGNTDIQNYLYHSLHHQPNYGHRNVEINFTNGTYDEVRRKKKDSGKENTIFSFRSPYRYNSAVKIVETKSIPEIRFNNYGASTANALDAKMETNYRRLQAKYSKYRDENDIKPSEARTHITEELNSALNNCLDLNISNLGEIETGEGTIYFTKTDQSSPFEFNVLSAGEKEVVDILLDLYLRKDVYDDTVFIIDEPELHINTAIQKKLLIEINKLVGDNCQIWVATHSIGFLRALQDDLSDDCQIIYFEPGADFATSTHTLKPIAKTRQNWLRIFETALDDLAHLVSPKRIVFCEGKAETTDGQENGLDAQVYNTIFSEAHHDTQFVSSGGNTEPQQRSEIALAILTKVFNELEILVLIDRDFGSGEPTGANDREVYLKNNSNNHRVLNRWELENYLYDKEVLKEYSVKNSLAFNETTYSQHVTDITNNNVKDMTGVIKNICGVIGSISSEKFKIELSKCINPEMKVYKELHDCIFY